MIKMKLFYISVGHIQPVALMHTRLAFEIIMNPFLKQRESDHTRMLSSRHKRAKVQQGMDHCIIAFTNNGELSHLKDSRIVVDPRQEPTM